MPLETDFNTSPYFDDYNENKKYYRILFRPTTAVQARELTQSQTIMQKQIERFGNHVFQDGSVVTGCASGKIAPFDFVRVADNFTANANAAFTSVNNQCLLVGTSSNVRALPVVNMPGLVGNYPSTNRFYIRYLNFGLGGNSSFSNGELINIYNEKQSQKGSLDSNNLINSIYVISTNSSINATGQGYGLTVEEGIVYQKGVFQIVDTQTIVVSEFSTNASPYVVGFQTTENIITENDDPSLLDNALGYQNENAPGAHRLQLTPTLVSKLKTDVGANNEAFTIIYEFSPVTGDIIINNSTDPYSQIGDYVSGVTYDEAGDFVTKPFQVSSGPSSNSSNTDAFSYQVSSGKGYVHGRPVDWQSSNQIDTDKAITTVTAPQQTISAVHGNYVYANQVTGILDYNDLISVDIYDTKQYAISNNFTTSVSGNKIGSALVQMVLYDNNDPGTPEGTYRIYLSDISMNSGKSFTNDAKSFVANTSINTYGNFRADINSSTIDSSLTSLVYGFGKKALKRLRSANGSVNNNEFYFRATSSANVSNSGTFSVTVNSSYTGGIDQVGYAGSYPFRLDTPSDYQFVLTFAANATTVNVGGTYSVSSSGNTLTGSLLNQYFANGESLKIFSGGAGTFDYRRIVSVNSSVAILNAPCTVTNASANVAKYFPAGYNVPFDPSYPGDRHIDITGSTTFSGSIGGANSSLPFISNSNPVYVQYRMLRTQATQAKKVINKNIYVKLNLSNNAGGFSGPWCLGLPDVKRIANVYGAANGYSNSASADITSYFNFSNGQKDSYYDLATLTLKPQYVGFLQSTPYIVVSLDHFSANLNNGIGFFSVDSYPTTNSTPDANTIAWAEIPVYSSGSSKYDLRDCVDFRAYRQNTAVSSTTLSGATENPVTTKSFAAGTTSYLVEPDTNFQADIEYFLGRMDLVTIDQSGHLGVIKGTPAENPKSPSADVDSMAIAVANVAPFPSLTAIDLSSYPSRKDLSVGIVNISNRVYTMKDIGDLDNRIKKLEYYTVLNQLEQSAQNLQVPDANGLNRFKNGIFSDPMTSFAFSNTAVNSGIRWAFDTRYGGGRPTYLQTSVDLVYDANNSSGVTLTGNYVTLPYTHENYATQPYATKYRNNNQDIYSWNGTMTLYPNYVDAKDSNTAPTSDSSLDLTQPWTALQNAGLLFGTTYGSWQVYAQTGNPYNGQYTYWDQLITNTYFTPVTNTIDLGKYVSDITVNPYIATTTVSFIATGVRPSARLYVYFDNQPVSQYCAPGLPNLIQYFGNNALGSDLTSAASAAAITTKPQDIIVRTGNFGDPIYSTANGVCYGIFQIPAGTFKTGDRQLLLTDTASIVTGADASFTKASATFTASNITVTQQDHTLTTTTPQIRQSYSYNYKTTYFRDPIAQSFTVQTPANDSGVFATKVDLFFNSASATDGMRVYVCGMNAGIPDSNRVYGWGRLDANQVTTSAVSANATTFTFNQPIYLAGNTDYAFYVEPESDTLDYTMWMANTGDIDVLSGAQVSKAPYTGYSFRSTNNKTWLPIQTEQVKFNLYVANFVPGSGSAKFTNENDDFIYFSGMSLSNNSITPTNMGDEVYLINASSNAIINTPAIIHGHIKYIDIANGEVILDTSTGGFSLGSTIGFFRFVNSGNTAEATSNSETLIATASISSINNISYHAIVPSFASMAPIGNNIEVNFAGYSNSGTADQSSFSLQMDTEKEMLDLERTLYSKSNEASGTGGNNKSLNVETVLTVGANNKYTSPVIDLSKKSVQLITNIINFDDTGESLGSGQSLCRYVGQPVVLAPGQDSEDLQVILSAYRPINTEVEVYVKFLSADDPASLDQKAWTLMVNQSPDLRCSSVDRYDYKEFTYKLPSSIQYSSYDLYANTTYVNNSADTISLSVGTQSFPANSVFSIGDKVYYSLSSSNTAINGLVANSYYYVSFANSSSIALANTPGGSNINISESRTSSPAEDHIISGPVVHNAFANTSNFGRIEYSDDGLVRYLNFNTFAIKIVLLSTSGVYVPKIQNLRGIALQV
jgi:Domain of unknown function (DUF4815)